MFILSPVWIKCKGITLSPHDTAAKIITEARFLLCITGETFEGLQAIIRGFLRFATLSTIIFFLKQKCKRIFPRTWNDWEILGNFWPWSLLSGQWASCSVFYRKISALGSLLTALLTALWIALRFFDSFNIDWFGSSFIELFRHAREAIIDFLTFCGLRWLLSTSPVTPILATNVATCLNLHMAVHLANSVIMIQPATKILSSVKEYSLKTLTAVLLP